MVANLLAILVAGCLGAGLLGMPIYTVTKNQQFSLIAGIFGFLMLAALAAIELL